MTLGKYFNTYSDFRYYLQRLLKNRIKKYNTELLVEMKFVNLVQAS